MKLNYILGISICWLLTAGCSDDFMSFEGTDRIQFATRGEEVYTFAYFPESKQRDTLHIKIMSVGEVRDYPRSIRFEQVTKEWKYFYDEKDSKKAVDSSYMDMDFPAVAGVHFEPLGENNTFVLPANRNELNLTVIVKRDDDALQKNAHKLVLHLLPSEDFGTGEPLKLTKSITISDKLERPTRWKDNSFYYARYLGGWSERKHRLMIDVTEEKWDNEFLAYIINSYDTWTLRDYYLAKIKKALADYNADPRNNPPMKDENGKEVVFP